MTTRINVNEASREQLIELLKQQRTKLHQEQARTKELEQQVRGLHDLIDEKNAEISALRQQGTMLTEKAASDEETIKALIAQLEGSHSPTGPNPPRRLVGSQGGVDNSVPGGATGTIVTGKVASGASQAVSPTMTAARAPHRVPPGGVGESGNTTNNVAAANMAAAAAAAAAQEAALQEKLAASAETISGKNSEIAKLETKVRELMEVNAFYTAIVAQHDDEEKRRHVLASKTSEEKPDGEVEDVPTLLHRIATLENHQEKLQRVVKQSEREKQSLLSENVQLREEASRLEMEAILAEQWAQRRDGDSNNTARGDSAAAQQLTLSPAARTPQTATTTPERVPAQVMSSPFLFGRGGGRTGGTHQASPLATSSGGRDVHARHHIDIHSLAPINVRNPDPQERELIDRIHLYEGYIAQMESYEADRQSSFDEMERSRAELFASMNEQLERQRKELHRLRRATLGTSNSVASLTTVTSVNEETTIPRTSPDRDAPPPAPPVPRTSVAVQTEPASEPTLAETIALATVPREVAEHSRESDAAMQREDAEEDRIAAALATTRLEMDEVEARLSLYADWAEGCLSHVSALHAAREATLIETITRLRDDTGDNPAPRVIDMPDGDVSVKTEVSAQFASFLVECQSMLHREEVGMCLEMYGDALAAYAALLSVAQGTDNVPIDCEEEDMEAALNARVLAGVHELATQPVVVTTVVGVPSLPPVLTNDDEENAAQARKMPISPPTTSHDADIDADVATAPPLPGTTVNDHLLGGPSSDSSAQADWDATPHADDMSNHSQTGDEAEERIGEMREESGLVSAATPGGEDDDTSSAPDSQRSPPTPSTPCDDISEPVSDRVSTSEEHADVAAVAVPVPESNDIVTRGSSLVEEDVAGVADATTTTQEEDDEEAEALLRQLALEAEAEENGALVTPYTDLAADALGDLTDAVHELGADIAALPDETGPHEADDRNDGGTASPGDEVDRAVSTPLDSSAPLSSAHEREDGAGGESEAYDEDLHSVISTTESSAAVPDRPAEDGSTNIGPDADQFQEARSPSPAEEEEQEEHSLPHSRMAGSQIRPSLPPLPENCTSDTVAAAIDACHQYAASRHVSRPSTPRRLPRSVMSSNRTSTSFLDSWSRNMPVPEMPNSNFRPPPPSADISSPSPPTLFAPPPTVLAAPQVAAQHQPMNAAAPPFSVDTTSTDDDFEADFDPFA